MPSREAAVRGRRGTWPAAFALLAALACGDGQLVGPTLEVVSQVDNFQFQASSLEQLTRTVDYSWEVTGTKASVEHASVLTGGSAVLVITDAAGLELYRRDVNEPGTFETAEGSAGRWTVTIEFSATSGLVRFALQTID